RRARPRRSLRGVQIPSHRAPDGARARRRQPGRRAMRRSGHGARARGSEARGRLQRRGLERASPARDGAHPEPRGAAASEPRGGRARARVDRIVASTNGDAWPGTRADGCAEARAGGRSSGGRESRQCPRAQMIATLRGHMRRKLEDRVVLECGGIGYEVFLPPIALRQLEGAEVGEKAPELELVIYYHATRDQPRPVLIGFTSDLDKEFFEKLITVKDIGPMVAARSLAAPVAELAAAIARQDEKYLRALPGIGPQKAKNIVAQLQSKVAKFALALEGAGALEPTTPLAADPDGLREMVWEVLVKQLGHRPSEASQLIADAMRRRPDIMTAEDLFNEIYRAAAASKRS